MMVFSLFFLCQNYFGFLEIHCFVSKGPILVNASHLEDLISTFVDHLGDLQHYLDAFQLMLYVADLYQPYHHSCSLVFLLELLHLLQWYFSDQVYKPLQCNFILLYVIIQRVKVPVAILTDLNLLPYQTVN